MKVSGEGWRVDIQKTAYLLRGGLFDNFGVKDSAVEILRTIDKIDKIGRDNVAKELVELNVPEATVNELLDILTFDGSNAEKVERLKGFAGCNEVFDTGFSIH